MFSKKVSRKRSRMKILGNIFIFICFISFSLSGCDTNIDDIDSDNHNYNYDYVNENSEQSYWRVCIDGKEFIEGPLRLSINLDFDGKPIPCEVN